MTSQPRQLKVLRLVLDSEAVEGFNAIDAVGLIAAPAKPASTQVP